MYIPAICALPTNDNAIPFEITHISITTKAIASYYREHSF